jgi:hypothetical protein
MYRVNEDVSGLTFEEWDPSTDTDSSQASVTMIVNSSELSSTDFDLREVIPLQLESVTCGNRRTGGPTLKQIHVMGTRRYVLSVDHDNELRSRKKLKKTLRVVRRPPILIKDLTHQKLKFSLILGSVG